MQEDAGSASSLRTVHADAEYRIAIVDSLVISVETGEPKVPHLDRVMSAVRDVARRERASAGLFVLIGKDAPPPNDEARAHIVRLFNDIEGTLGALAYVMEGEGFMAAAKRSVLTLMTATKRYRFPVKVFRTVADAIPWLVTTLGNKDGTMSTPRLVTEVLRLREEHFAKQPHSGGR